LLDEEPQTHPDHSDQERGSDPRGGCH
jgi:hypothetical protein